MSVPLSRRTKTITILIIPLSTVGQQTNDPALTTFVTLDHKTSHKETGSICGNTQQHYMGELGLINLRMAYKTLRLLELHIKSGRKKTRPPQKAHGRQMKLFFF